MNTSNRLTAFEYLLIGGLAEKEWAKVCAWVVLPNHYHVLVSVDLHLFSGWIRRVHNGTATEWNRVDRIPGRKVWHRFSDRLIRSDRHYWASVNYIHGNPVKHGHVGKAEDWPCSSIHRYLDDIGKEELMDMVKQYPVDDYGKGWDESFVVPS